MEWKNIHFIMWDLGGQESLRAAWNTYYSNTEVFLLYLVIVIIRVCNYFTKKPAETRQGKGKGPVDHWVAVIKPGHVLFEIAGCSLSLAREALGLADSKLPFRCRLVTRQSSF